MLSADIMLNVNNRFLLWMGVEVAGCITVVEAVKRHQISASEQQTL